MKGLNIMSKSKHNKARSKQNTKETYTETVTRREYVEGRGKGFKGDPNKAFQTRRQARNSRLGKFDSTPSTTRRQMENNMAILQGKENDPSWYNQNGQLVKDAGSVSFYTPAGAPYFKAASGDLKGSSVPGILTLDIVPNPGISTDRTSALNLAALKLYTNMRKSNSGATNYSHADMMMYCLAMDSVYTMYSEMLRLYGIMNSWSQYNRYKPEHIVNALGYSYKSFRTRLADFRAWLNIWIKRANSFSLPVSFTISKRHSWLFSNIWSDSSNAKAQLYAYRPAGYYLWQDQSDPNGSSLAFKPWNNGGATSDNPSYEYKTFEYVRDKMDELLDNIANSEDIAIIGGDLEKAFGSENMFSMATIDDNYTIEPTFSEEVLMQIENTMFLPTNWHDLERSVLDIKQDVNHNLIKCNPEFWIKVPHGSNNYYYLNKFADIYADNMPLNVHFDNPTPDDVMVATRNKFYATTEIESEEDDYNTFVVEFETIGCDICCSVLMWTLVNDTTHEPSMYWSPELQKMEVIPYIGSLDETSTNPVRYSNVISTLFAIQLFDWHPAIVGIVKFGRSDNPQVTASTVFGLDLDNYTTIDYNTLHKLHDAAVYNMWDLPF